MTKKKNKHIDYFKFTVFKKLKQNRNDPWSKEVVQLALIQIVSLNCCFIRWKNFWTVVNGFRPYAVVIQ